MITHIFGPQELEKAAELLKQGELVAFPTETVYGLGARLFDERAAKKIFQVKGRPTDNPLIVHIAKEEDAAHLAQEVPEEFSLLARAFFPGPLTIILRRKAHIPAVVSAGLDTIALRLPGHPLARQLISLVGEPLIAPSANISGRPSSTLAAHVLEDFAGKIAAVVDGGECILGLESTVLSLKDPSRPTLLRPGAITQEALAEVLKVPIFLPTSSTEIASPGMKYRHYAPKAPLHLVFSREAFETRLKLPKQRMVIGGKEFPLERSLLYKWLRLSDSRGDEEILVFCDPQARQDVALMNRLLKASCRAE